MFQVRVHGRGGQGVVTAAELLSVAAFADGRWAQAFPSFGSERTGAPVVAFCRIGDTEIRTREPVTEPDALIVQDATLLQQVNLFAGLRPDGYVLLNSARRLEELGLAELLGRLRRDRVRAVPATDLALQHTGRPVPNAVLLGGFAAISQVVSLEAVITAIRGRFRGPVADGNVAAATDAYRLVGRTEESRIHAPAD